MKKLPKTFYKRTGNNGKKQSVFQPDSPDLKWARIWQGMKARCYYKTSHAYNRYGKRGIKICKEWHDVDNFIKWCHETYPKQGKWSIDRIDNNKDYSPENCRWASCKEQARNRSSNVVYKGKTLSQWAEENGLKTTTINRRLHVMKWSIEDAVTKPAGHKGSRKE